MNFKKHILLAVTLTFSLTAVGCGGSVNSTGPQDMASSLGGSGLTPMGDATGGLQPIEGMDTGTMEMPVDGVYAEEGAYVEGELPAEGLPAGEYVEGELPAEELPAEELPAEEFGDELAADAGEFSDDLGEIGDLGDIPDLDVGAPYVPPGSSLGGGGSDYSVEGNFKIDRDTFNQWQAVNVTSNGSSIYVAAVDVKTPSKGTVISMDASTGENWDDLGGGIVSTISLGAFGYDMGKTITGITVDSSGNIVVADAQSALYQILTPDFDIEEKEVSLSEAKDIAFVNGAYYVVTMSGIQKFDSSLASGSGFGSLTPSGGIGSDNQGNLYVVSGTSIQRLDANGQATQVVSGLSSPIDVTVDPQGNIFVLESGTIKHFNASGEAQGEFGMAEFTDGKGIFADSSGAIYVADFGTSHQDSQVVKFSKGGFSTASQRRVSTMNAADVN